MTAFTLQPFAHPHPDITITGTLEREGDQVAISYTLSGHLDQVTLPSASTQPTRRPNLWEATCFEFFLGQPTLAPYWEFNLSPSGDWNVFYLEAYRQGLQVESALQTLPFQVQRGSSSLTLTLAFSLRRIIATIHPLEVGICAVIQSPNFPYTYWALTHCGPQADFHRRDSFILQI